MFEMQLVGVNEVNILLLIWTNTGTRYMKTVNIEWGKDDIENTNLKAH